MSDETYSTEDLTLVILEITKALLNINENLNNLNESSKLLALAISAMNIKIDKGFKHV